VYVPKAKVWRKVAASRLKSGSPAIARRNERIRAVGHIWHQKSLQAFSQAFQDTTLSRATPTVLPGVLALKGRRVIDI